MNLLTQIRSLFEPVLAGLAPDPAKVPDYLAMVKPAANPEHGDYQANFTMALAKALNRPKEGPQIAKEIVAKLPPNDVLEGPRSVAFKRCARTSNLVSLGSGLPGIPGLAAAPMTSRLPWPIRHRRVGYDSSSG